MIAGRDEHVKIMQEDIAAKCSSFVAITGRRRVGKTFLIREVYQKNICFMITGIQNADVQTQINNFVQKNAEYNTNSQVFGTIDTWQKAFFLFKNYLKSLPKNKKQVIFMDELPWMATARSGFIQQLAHLWNDYLLLENK